MNMEIVIYSAKKRKKKEKEKKKTLVRATNTNEPNASCVLKAKGQILILLSIIGIIQDK